MQSIEGRRGMPRPRPPFPAVSGLFGKPTIINNVETLANLPFDRFCRDQAMFGDAAELVDRLQAAREEFGLSQIIAWFDQGNVLPRAEVERAMRRFAEEIMPRLA